ATPSRPTAPSTSSTAASSTRCWGCTWVRRRCWPRFETEVRKCESAKVRGIRCIPTHFRTLALSHSFLRCGGVDRRYRMNLPERGGALVELAARGLADVRVVVEERAGDGDEDRWGELRSLLLRLLAAEGAVAH